MIQVPLKAKYRSPGKAKGVKNQRSGNSTPKKRGVPGMKVHSVNRKVMVLDAATGKVRMREKPREEE